MKFFLYKLKFHVLFYISSKAHTFYEYMTFTVMDKYYNKPKRKDPKYKKQFNKWLQERF